jgi:hypothetical protein
MNEPRRWLDNPDALSPEELRVLEAGLAAEVPKGVKDAVKSALLAQLPTPAPEPLPETVAVPDAAAGTAGATTVATATLGGFLKSTGVGFALGVAATVSWGSIQQDQPAAHGDTRPGAPPVAASVSKPGMVDSVGASQVPAPTPSNETRFTLRGRDAVTVLPPEANARDADIRSDAPPAQAPSVSTFPETLSTPEPTSSESSRLARARALLRNHHASAAFAALESLRRDHPRGLLVQERELLTIEALHAMGDEQATRTRAQDFLTRYPTSPHTASVRRVLERRPTSSP